MPLEQAMERAADRVQLPNYRMLFLAMRTGMERGGKLADTLKTIAESLREIARLEDKVDTMTAQGRASARMMSVMPLVIMFILYVIDPQSVQDLFTTGTGRVLLIIIGGVLVTAWAWMHRVVSVDV
jgi:tight adherence protein B